MAEVGDLGGTDPSEHGGDEAHSGEAGQALRPLIETPQLHELAARRPTLMFTEDWGQWRHDAAHTGFSPNATVDVGVGRSLMERWRTKIGPDTYPGGDARATDSEFTDAGIRASLVAAHGAVYAPALDGYLAKLEAATGRKLWEATLSRWLVGTPAVATMSDGRRFVFVTISYPGSCAIQALDDATGQIAWGFALQSGPSPYINAPTVVGDIVYVADTGGNVYAFDGTKISPPPSGSPPGTPGSIAPLWKASPTAVGSSAPKEFRASPTVAVAEDRLLIPDESGTLYGLRASDGKLVWTHQPGSCANCSNTPAVSRGMVYYAVDYGPFTVGVVFALNASDGTLVWVSGVPNRIYGMPYYQSSLAVAYDTVYVPAPAALWAIDAGNGGVKWKSPTIIKEGHVWYLTSPAVANNRVYAGLFSSPADRPPPGGYAVFDAHSGAVLVSHVDLATVYNSLAVAGDKVFMGFHNRPPGHAVAFGSPVSLNPAP